MACNLEWLMNGLDEEETLKEIREIHKDLYWEDHEILGFLLINSKILARIQPDGSMGEPAAVCNDVFMWACADAVDIDSREELLEVFDFWVRDPVWGVEKWACKKKNLQPQLPVKNDMIVCGSWEDWMDDLNEKMFQKERE